MKKNTLPAAVAALCTLSGFFCIVLRRWLLNTGVDQKGLLVKGHPGDLISWGIVIICLGALCALTLYYKPQCHFNSEKAYGGVPQVCALASVSGLLGFGNGLAAVTTIVAFAVAVCCVVQQMLQICKKEIPTLLHCVPVIFYLLFLLCRYQSWSREPQLQLSVFSLLALVGLTVTAYQRAAFSAGLGNSKVYFFFSNASLLLCLAAVVGSDMPLFFSLMAIATLFDGCSLASEEEA